MHFFVRCVTRDIILLQPTTSFIVFKQRNKQCYNVLEVDIQYKYKNDWQNTVQQ